MPNLLRLDVDRVDRSDGWKNSISGRIYKMYIDTYTAKFGEKNYLIVFSFEKQPLIKRSGHISVHLFTIFTIRLRFVVFNVIASLKNSFSVEVRTSLQDTRAFIASRATHLVIDKLFVRCTTQSLEKEFIAFIDVLLVCS